eukprot:401220-Rhodomonas_salina.4
MGRGQVRVQSETNQACTAGGGVREAPPPPTLPPTPPLPSSHLRRAMPVGGRARPGFKLDGSGLVGACSL